MYSCIRKQYATLIFPFVLPDLQVPNCCGRVESQSVERITQRPPSQPRQVSIQPIPIDPDYADYAYLIDKFLEDDPIEPEKSEYKALKDLDQSKHVLKFGADAANKHEHRKLNRYVNIYPYDFNRIKLQTAILGSDYINGSHITFSQSDDDLCPTKRIFDGGNVKPFNFSKFCNISFLAAQGPLPSSSAHFWQAVYENDVDIIVMLTKLKEGSSGPGPGATKCTQYWPEVSEKSITVGNFEITILEETEPRPEITKRTFSVKGGETTNFNVEKRVTQLHYVGWPDYGVPEEDDHLINLVKQVRYIIQSDKNKISKREKFMVLAHCSAGVGRTGTFIAMYQLMDQIEEMFQTKYKQCDDKNRYIDIFNTVLFLRSKRVEMVQSWAQYRYLYKSVAAYAKQIKAMNEKVEDDYVI